MLNKLSSLQNALSQNVNFKGNSEGKNDKGDVKFRTFYLNDVHAQNSKMGALMTASENYNKSVDKTPDVDSFKLAAGDILIGKNKEKNKLWVDFLNKIKLDLSTIGNHEMDNDEAGLADRMGEAKYKYVASNIHVGKDSPLAPRIKEGKLVNSCVITKNGHKYGFIGAMPVDIKKHISKDVKSTNLKVDNFDETKNEIQNTVNNLEKNGVNKIFLVSHLGLETEKKIAQNVSGIDVIVGGHSHDLIKGATAGNNLLKSPKGDPVLLLMTGKDGKHYGDLEATFDSKGVLKTNTIKNNVGDTEPLPKSLAAMDLKDQDLGKAKPLGILTEVNMPKSTKREENPVADLVADSLRKKSGAQIAIINGQAIRGKLNTGVVTDRDMDEVITFQNKMYKVKMSEKDLIDTLNFGAQHTAYQVSGLKYKVGADKKVKDVVLENNDGTFTKLNAQNPSPDKKITAAYDDYLLKGEHGCKPLNRPQSDIIEQYPWLQKDAAVELIKDKKFVPIDMSAKHRIDREDPDIPVPGEHN